MGGDATLRSCGLVTSSVLGQPRVENWDKTLEKKTTVQGKFTLKHHWENWRKKESVALCRPW